MSRNILVVVALLVAAAPPAARADLPSPVNWIIPPYLTLVGQNGGGIPDSIGGYTVVIRDLANNPIANASIYLDFGACTDVRFCAVQPSNIVECSHDVVRGFTDAAGSITFLVLGAGRTTGGTPGAGVTCLNVLVEGVSGRHVTVCAPDLNGAVAQPGVDVTDLAAWLRDFGMGVYVGRSDFNHDGGLGIADLAVWLRILGSGASSVGCTTYCP